MAKITRKVAKIFGSSSGINQIAEYGSLAAGSPVFSTDPTVIQSLGNWLTGWFGAVVGGNSPAIEDMNAFCYVESYQTAYLMQAGVAEWDSTTTYYIGSIANNGFGQLYRSITDTNLNNALTDTTNWLPDTGAVDKTIDPSTQSPYTLTSADNRRTFLVNSVNGAQTFILPAAIANFTFNVKDVGGLVGSSNITIQRAASENIENLGANFLCKVDYGYWGFNCDATNWWLT